MGVAAGVYGGIVLPAKVTVGAPANMAMMTMAIAAMAMIAIRMGGSFGVDGIISIVHPFSACVIGEV